MAKKSLKRGLALGALMAFVITGSAMASNPPTIQRTVGSNDSITVSGNWDIGIYNNSGSNIDFNGKEIVVDITPGTGWKSGNVGVRASFNESSQSIINLGKAGVTDTIKINVVDNSTSEDIAVGLWADGMYEYTKDSIHHPQAHGGLLNVNGKDLLITGSSKVGEIYGIYAQNRTTDPGDKSIATIVIDAENTTVNVKSDVPGNADGIVAMSNGIVKINSNLTVTADSVIVARGGAEVNINTDGKHSTVLNGDIEFNYDGPTSGTDVNALVNVNLSGTGSVWEGNSKVTWNELSEDKHNRMNSVLSVDSLNITLADGAKWIVTKPVDYKDYQGKNDDDETVYSGQQYIGINKLTMNNGSVDLTKVKEIASTGKAPAIEIGVLDGSGATFDMNNYNTIKVETLKNTDVTLNSGMMKLVGGDTTIKGKLTLNKGANIEDSKDGQPINLTLAAGSKLVIDNLNNYLEEYNGGETYAVISTKKGTVTAEEGAKISIGTASEGTYKIVEAAKVINNMSDEDVTFDGGLKTGTWINSDKEMNLKVAIKDLKEETELVPTENAGLVEAALKNINNLNKNNNTQQLADFFNKISQLAEEANSGTGKAQVKAAIASSVQSGTNNGAASTAASVVNNVSSITNNRLSIVAPAPKGGMGVGLFAEESGAGVWAQYLHGKDKAEDMPSGSSKTQYKNSYNGILVGADFKKVDKFQSGIAFSYTDGDGSNSSTTGGTLGSTGHTDFKSYGVTYYGSIKNDTTNTMFDIGYNHSKADSDTNILLTGHTDSSTSKTNTWSAGVTVEKSYTDGNNGAQFIPYVGVRYMNINTDDFTTKMGYHNAMDDQNVFLIPVGIKFRQENVYKNGWKVTPKADLSYVWATGDTDSNVNVTIPGMPSGASTIGYTVMDDGSFLGTVGVEAEKGDWTYGLSYSYQKGEYQRSDKWFVDVRYSF